jgi:PAS domain S-box-containing protein
LSESRDRAGPFEDLFRELLDEARVLSFATDAEGRFVHLGASCERFLGRPAEALLGQSLLDSIHPEDAEATGEAFRRIREGHRDLRFEARSLSDEGGERELSWNLAVLTGSDGRILGIQGTAREVDPEALEQPGAFRRRARGAEDEILDRLYESEGRYRALFESAGDGVAVVARPGGEIIEANLLFAELLERDREEIHGPAFLEFVSPGARRLVSGLLERLGGSGRARTDEVPLLLPDGNVRHADLALAPVRFAGREAAVVILRDARERRQERRRFEDAASRLREALQGVSDGVLVLDSRGMVLEANPSVLSETGLEAGEVLGRDFRSLWERVEAGGSGADRDNLAGAVDVAVAEGRTTQLAGAPLSLRVAGSGPTVSVHARIVPRRRDGRVEGATVYLRFLTEKERLRAAVRESEERYRLVFAQAGDPIALLDGEGRYLEMNARYEVLAGQSREALLGESFSVWARDPRDQRAVERHIESLASGETARIEITRRRHDGEERRVDLAMSAVSIAGQPCLLAIERDVTTSRRRRLEAEVAARVARLLVDSLDARAALPTIAEQLRRLVPFERIGILWPAAEGEGFRVFAAWDLEGISGPSAGALVPPDRELSDVHRGGKPLHRRVAPDREPSAWTEPGSEEAWGQLLYPLVHRGRPVGLLTLEKIEDGPARREAERALGFLAPPLAAAVENTRLFRRVRESEEKFRTLVENSRDVIFRMAIDGQFRYLNPVVEQMLGYPPEALYQDPGLPLRLMHPSDRQRYRSAFERMMAGTDFPPLEIRLRHRSERRWIWVFLSVYPLRDASGNLVGLEGILRDDTERKEAEAAAREYERRLLALNELNSRLFRERSEKALATEAVRGLVALLGAQGGMLGLLRPGGHLQAVVREGLGGMPLPPGFHVAEAGDEPLQGLNPPLRAFLTGDLVEVSDLAQVPRDIPWAANLVAHGFLQVVAAPLEGESGTLGSLALYFSRPVPLEEKDQTVLRLAVTQVAAAFDRARRLGEAQEVADEAQRARRDLKSVSDILSRDLRAPAASLRGLTAMLDRGARGKTATLVERIGENARELERTLEGMVRLLQASTVSPKSMALDPGPVARAVAARHEGPLLNRGGEVEVAETWPEVLADPELLEAILGELVENAVRFAGARGKPRVSLSWRTPEELSRVDLRVEDNGPGLSAADRRRAFDPLRRFENDAKHQGPGLGLTVSRRLAEALGGRLELREAEEGGCLAVLRLVRAGSSPDRRKPPEEEEL